MEFYGGAEGRTSEGDDLKRCIQRILEIELVDRYQKNSRPSEEVRGELEEMVGENWREEQGVPGRKYIGIVAKREEVKKEENPLTQEECNEVKGVKERVVEQESGESKGVEDEKIAEKESGESKDIKDEKITEKEVQEISVQTKEVMNEEKKAEDKGKEEDQTKENTNEGKKAEDKGNEEDIKEMTN